MRDPLEDVLVKMGNDERIFHPHLGHICIDHDNNRLQGSFMFS